MNVNVWLCITIIVFVIVIIVQRVKLIRSNRRKIEAENILLKVPLIITRNGHKKEFQINVISREFTYDVNHNYYLEIYFKRNINDNESKSFLELWNLMREEIAREQGPSAIDYEELNNVLIIKKCIMELKIGTKISKIVELIEKKGEYIVKSPF